MDQSEIGSKGEGSKVVRKLKRGGHVKTKRMYIHPSVSI